MMSRLDGWLSARLGRWVDGVRRRAGAVAVACLAVTLALGVYAALSLRINSDNLALLSEDIPARRNHAVFASIFPNLENALFVVVDAQTPELLREATDALVERLRESPELFEDVYLPGGGDFFRRHGLLYRDVADLEEFSDRLATLQPILATLERDPSIASLSKLVLRGLEEASTNGGAAAADWPLVLDRVSQATVDVYTEFPVAVSWEEVMLRGSSLDATRRQVVVVHPALDFSSPVAAARAVGRIHDEARVLDLEPERGVQVRVTGNPALNYEEMLGIAWDIGAGGVFCFFLVAGILYLALGAWRLVAAAIATLLLGLVWAAAIAAAAIGHLTVVSLSVAILFIGLGVDFGIHLGMRYARLLREGRPHADALRGAAEDIGSALVLCTFTTAIGFFVFVPTDYVGVAELGLIAGSSMIAILFLTFTFFPALLSSWLAMRGEQPADRELRFEASLGHAVEQHARPVRWAAVCALLAGLAALPLARFDPNVVDMRDPGTESVQAMNDLLADSGQASPWYVDAVAPDLDAARDLARRLTELEPVTRAITLADYVPTEQEEKVEILADLSFLLEAPVAEAEPAEPPPVAEQVRALRELHEYLSEPAADGTPPTLGRSMRQLRDHLGRFLERVDRDEDPASALARLEELLLANFAQQMPRLRESLDAGDVTLETLPPEIVERMVAPDGRARVQIFPRHNLRREERLREFTAAVAEVAPSASGIAYNLIAFEEATKRSFVQALLSAFALITLLLLWLWRRVTETLLVLAPLLLAAVLSVAAMGLLGIAFNFVNVIVLPLMFGIGVDSGIHLVHRARELKPGEEVLGTTTAQAVFYSALTTLVSFGSLGLSSHVGMSGLGILLSIGMVLTVVCNLVVLPALLVRWKPERDAPS